LKTGKDFEVINKNFKSKKNKKKRTRNEMKSTSKHKQ